MARTAGKRKHAKKARLSKTKWRGAPVGLTSDGLRRYRHNVGSPDKKYVDTAITGVATTTGLVSSLLIPVSQGNGDNDRIGRHLTMTNISVHGYIYRNAEAGLFGTMETAELCRLILVYDKQANGIAVDVEDVLAVLSPATTADINAYRNMNQLDRFVVLKDKVIRMDVDLIGESTGATACGIQSDLIPFKFNKKVALPVDWKDNSGVIANCMTGSLYMIALSAAGYATIDLRCRVKYLDIYPYN